ncbi:MAG: UDP-N-acetylmuramoyl-tripeptide--D-alanyl-D-alanine ligase [Alphaproteobacteria bacterium]|nr:UDP-N-acetylmuramoyl-tripeptide--D-alanyl-D-alanine ligase [Alphaproteobacteria bacterium]
MWTTADIEKATQGNGQGANWRGERVSIDTRTLEAGDIYVALQGENVDGHNYVKEALEKGAVAAVVHHIVEGADVQKQLLVEDTEEALREMAAYHRARLSATFVGVTGSVGKTGAKEMLRTTLSTKGKTYASHGNFNNHIGTPLCLVNMPMDADYGVFEMGMNHAGEISQLSTLVQPHLAMITTVEAVHLEFFDSEDAIADAKAEIFDGMTKSGSAVLNGDNVHFLRLKRAAEKHGLGNIISFGVNEMAMCRLTEYRADMHGSEVTATVSGTPLTYRIGTVGKHWALTSVAVLAAADALGCDLAKAAAALETFHEPKGRGKISVLPWQSEAAGLLLVDDSYNASPSSMMAAFEKMYELKQANPNRRMVAVLGDMLELGDLGPKMHANLAQALKKAEIDVVHTAGKLMKNLRDKLPTPMHGSHANTAAELQAPLEASLQVGDVVLVKGSQGSNMWKLVDAIEILSKTGAPVAIDSNKGTRHVV